MIDDVPPRVVEQRCRSRIMECLGYLQDGDSIMRTYGTSLYINYFFDWMPIDDHVPLVNSAMTVEEIRAVEEVRALMVQAVQGFPQSDDDFISSGWIERISGPAAAALRLMSERGVFSEEVEEDTPSQQGRFDVTF